MRMEHHKTYKKIHVDKLKWHCQYCRFETEVDTKIIQDIHKWEKFNCPKCKRPAYRSKKFV